MAQAKSRISIEAVVISDFRAATDYECCTHDPSPCSQPGARSAAIVGQHRFAITQSSTSRMIIGTAGEISPADRSTPGSLRRHAVSRLISVIVFGQAHRTTTGIHRPRHRAVSD